MFLPEWMPPVLLGVCAIAMVVLLWRVVQRSRTNDPDPSNAGHSPQEHRDASAGSNSTNSVLKENGVSWSERALFAEESQRSATLAANTIRKVAPDQVPHADARDYVFGSVTPILAALFPDSETRRAETKRELQAAGYLSPHAGQNLAAVRYVAMMSPIVFGLALLLSVPAAFEIPVLVGMVVLSGVGWAYPRVHVRNQAKTRMFRIEQALPDLIDMLNMCVSQGLTVPESLRRISHELRNAFPDLTRELRIVSEQTELGSLEQSLENFAERIESEEVRSFTSLLIQTERMGTSITQALSDYSDNFREGHRQEADRKANNAAFKLLFPTVLCLMPAVYLFLLGPAVIELSHFLDGEGRQVLEQGQQAVEDYNSGRSSNTRPR